MVEILKKKTLVLGFVLLFFSLALIPQASSDGGPLYREENLTLRQNRQLVNIQVNGKSQTMDLFLSIATLDPEENLKVVVPLRTKPTTLDARETTDNEFLESIHWDLLESLHRKQENGFEMFLDNFYYNLEEIGKLEMMGGFLHALLSRRVRGTGTTTGPIESYKSEGLSAGVYSVDSAKSLENLLESLDMDLPEDVSSTLSSYSDQYVAVVNADTKPPIPENKFDILMSEIPAVMSQFEGYVEYNPTTPGYDYYDDIEFMDPSLQSMVEEAEAHGVGSLFKKLVANTYGIKDVYGIDTEVDGFVLHFEMPLDNGGAYFPLGTTPAWGGASQVKVVFSCSEDKSLNFDKSGNEVFHDGRHYYYWEFTDESPSYDLEGKLEGESIWNGVSAELTSFVSSRALSLFLALSIFIFVYFLFLFPFTKGKWKAVVLAVILFFAAMLVSLPVSIVAIFFWILLKGYSPISSIDRVFVSFAEFFAGISVAISAFALGSLYFILIHEGTGLIVSWNRFALASIALSAFSCSGLIAVYYSLRKRDDSIPMIGVLLTWGILAISFFWGGGLIGGIIGSSLSIPFLLGAIFLEQEKRPIRKRLSGNRN